MNLIKSIKHYNYTLIIKYALMINNISDNLYNITILIDISSFNSIYYPSNIYQILLVKK